VHWYWWYQILSINDSILNRQWILPG